VLVVSFARIDVIEALRAHLGLPFPIAADPDRCAYRAYGLLRGSVWRVWHPRVLWRYVVLLIRGRKLRRPARGEDLSQLGGDFVIGPDGSLQLAYRSERPDDRPSIDEIIAAIGETEVPETMRRGATTRWK